MFTLINDLKLKSQQNDYNGIIKLYQNVDLTKYSKLKQLELYNTFLKLLSTHNKTIAIECAEKMKKVLLMTKTKIANDTLTQYNQNINNLSPGFKFNFNHTNAFIISLGKDTERMKSMDARMKHFNIKYTFWKGIYPNELVDQFVHNLSGGEKGCTQAHLNIYKHMIAHKIPYALILEDDACFDREWLQKLSKFDLDYSWDIIQLNASEKEDKKHQWVKAKEQYMAAANIVSYKAAAWILKNFKDIYCCIDWMTTRLQLQNHSYTYFPWLAIQEYKIATVQANEKFEHDFNKMKGLLKEINYDLKNYLY